MQVLHLPHMKKTRMLRFVFLLFALGCLACEVSPYKDGALLYKSQCANCHMDNGEGLKGLIPTLVKSDYLTKNRAKLPCILKIGLQDSILVNGQLFAEKMPGVNALSPIDIANILNFIGHSWGNNLPEFQLEEVKKNLKNCE